MSNESEGVWEGYEVLKKFMSKKNIENKHTQKYLGNTISYKTRASRQTSSFDVSSKINDKREIIIHSNVSEEKINPWVVEENETLSLETPSLPPLLLKSFSIAASLREKILTWQFHFPFKLLQLARDIKKIE